MSEQSMKIETELEMKASAELKEQIAKELLQDDPDASEAKASIEKFVKDDKETEDGNT